MIEDGFQDPPRTGNSSWTDENQKEYKEKLKKNATALSLSILESLVLKRQKMHGRFCKSSFKAQIKPSPLNFKICGETLIIWQWTKLNLSNISIQELLRLLIKSRAMEILFKSRNLLRRYFGVCLKNLICSSNNRRIQSVRF